MKTQIIQLEPHDDYISVRDRMGWGQTPRVLLVWPKSGKLLHRRLDLTLIKRYSTSLGSQLALVTRDHDVRYQARQLDIPVYKNVKEAEQRRWKRPRKRRKNKRSQTLLYRKRQGRETPNFEKMRDHAHPTLPRWYTHPVFRISVFTIGVLSMLVVAGVFIPSAEIYITPATTTESITIDVSASPDNKTVELSGAVPAYFEKIIVEGRGRTPATGVTTIPRQSAFGRVTFLNLTDEDITVPVGTVVSTQDEPPIRFFTTSERTIPAGSDGITIPIEAINPGSNGNVSAQKITSIEGPLGLNLSATNQRATTGGSDFSATTPSESDYQLIFDKLFDSLQKTAQTEFEFNTETGDIALSLTPTNRQALEEDYQPETGEPADFLELNLRAEYQFPYAAGTDLHQLGRIVLDRHINDDFTPRPETLQIVHLSEPRILVTGKSTWRMQASWEMGAKLNKTEATSMVLGKAPDDAVQILDEQTPIEPGTNIYLFPEWWPRLPVLPFRIKIINSLDSTTSVDQDKSHSIIGLENYIGNTAELIH